MAWQDTYEELGTEVQAAKTAALSTFMRAPAESAIGAAAAMPPIQSRQQRADQGKPLSSTDRTKVLTITWRAIAQALLKHIGPISGDNTILVGTHTNDDGVTQLDLRTSGGSGPASSDFVTGFFLDFQTLPPQELLAGENIIAGKTWYMRHPLSTSWYATNPNHIDPPNGLGFGFGTYSNYPIVSAKLVDLGIPVLSKLSELWVFARLSYSAVNAAFARLGLGTVPVDAGGTTPLEYIAQQGGSSDGSLRQVHGLVATASSGGTQYPSSSAANTADYTLALRWVAGGVVEVYSGDVEVSEANSSEYMRGAMTLRATLRASQAELGATPASAWSENLAAISLTHGVNATTGSIHWKQLRIDYVEAGTQKGEQGDKGDEGDPGNDGTRGALWLVRASAPDNSDGLDGDMCLVTANGNVYGPKTSGAWGAVAGNLMGPAGTSGAPERSCYYGRVVNVDNATTGTAYAKETRQAWFGGGTYPASNGYHLVFDEAHARLIATQSGSVTATYYSLDGGSSWVAGGAFPASVSTSWLLYDPVLGRVCTISQSNTQGGFYTSNGGVTWTRSASTTVSSTWRKGVFDPVHGRVVFVSSSSTDSIYTTDGGVTWAAGGTLPCPMVGIAFDPPTGRLVALPFGSNTASAYSTDGGTTWTTGGTVPNPNPGGWFGFVYDPIHAKLVATSDSTATTTYSTNGGTTWSNGGNIPSASYFLRHMIYDKCSGRLLFSDGNSNNIVFSEDGGLSWAAFDTGKALGPVCALWSI